MSNEFVLSARNLSKTFDDGNQQVSVLNDINLDVRAGERLAIVGASGSGKSTLMNIIRGLKEIDDGERWVLAGTTIGYLQQDVPVKVGQTVREFILEDLSPESREEAQSYRMEMVAEPLHIKLSDRMDNLSGGQKQRLSITTALVHGPKVFFLDEPTTGLDPQARRNLWDLIEQVRAKGISVILTTHYMDGAEVLCDRIAIMDNGKIVAIDTPRNLIQQLLDRGFKKKQEVQQASLEDVFIDLTGKALRDGS